MGPRTRNQEAWPHRRPVTNLTRMLALGGLLGLGVISSEARADVADWNARANEFYDLGNVITIDIWMDAAKWDKMASEYPYPTQTWESLCDFAFIGDRYDDYKPTRVRISGSDPAKDIDVSNAHGVKNVEIKKKSYCGSFSMEKPSLKIKFKDTTAGDAVQELIGVKKIMLNNAKEDPAIIRQCVGFKLLQDAGVPYARCNFVRLRVNDVDVGDGLYVNVEPVEEMFVYNNFGNVAGNDYEFDKGEDFELAMKDRTEFKGFSSWGNKEDFERASEQLALGNLTSVFDMDAFIKYHAMEIILGNADSYTGNKNNVQIYNDVVAVEHPDPALGQVNFKFISAGIDHILGNGLYDIFSLGLVANAVVSDPVMLEKLRHQIYMYIGSILNPKAIDGALGAWVRAVEAAANAAKSGVVFPGTGDQIIDELKQIRPKIDNLFGVTAPTTAVRFEGWNNECAHRGRASVDTDAWSIDHKPCSSATGQSYLFELVPVPSMPGYFTIAHNETGAPFTYGSRADSSHFVSRGVFDVFYGRVGGASDYPQVFGLIPIGEGTSRRYEIQSVDTGLCWHFSSSLTTSEGNYQVYQATCDSAAKNQINFVEPPAPPACNESTAIDLGGMGNNVTVPADGCVKVQNGYPWYWGTSRRMKLENPAGSYPVPFTWSNVCSGGSGTESFTSNWQAKYFNNINASCATVIDLQGATGSAITLRYYPE